MKLPALAQTYTHVAVTWGATRNRFIFSLFPPAAAAARSGPVAACPVGHPPAPQSPSSDVAQPWGAPVATKLGLGILEPVHRAGAAASSCGCLFPGSNN